MGEMLYLCGVVEKQTFIRRKLKYREYDNEQIENFIEHQKKIHTLILYPPSPFCIIHLITQIAQSFLNIVQSYQLKHSK